MLFFYIRHGTPIYHPDSLTEHGKEEAKALAERFAYGGLDKVYSSSSVRAFQTAEATCAKLGLQCEQLDWAREDLAGQDFGVKADDGNTIWCFWHEKYISMFQSEEVTNLRYDWPQYEGFNDTNFKSGYERIGKESDKFFKQLGFEHDLKRHVYNYAQKRYDKVALFAHGGFGMAFLSYLLDIPYPEFCLKFVHLHTTGVAVIEFPENNKCGYCMPRIVEYGNDAHLYKCGLEPYHFVDKF